MYSSNTTRHDGGRNKQWKRLQPQTGRLDLTVAKLPGLHNLVRLANGRGNDRNRVFNRDLRHIGTHKKTHEIKRPLLATIKTLGCEVPRA